MISSRALMGGTFRKHATAGTNAPIGRNAPGQRMPGEPGLPHRRDRFDPSYILN